MEDAGLEFASLLQRHHHTTLVVCIYITNRLVLLLRIENLHQRLADSLQGGLFIVVIFY